MDGGDGWRVIGCTGGAQDRMTNNTMMLRFRPIAPKPTTGNSSSGYSPTDVKGSVFTETRTKRKYVRVKKTSAGCTRRRRKLSDQERESGDAKRENIATLQLLPERTDGDKHSPSGGSPCNQVDGNHTIKDFPDDMSDREEVESWLTVESVMDAFNHVGWTGSTDSERVKNLEMDACPVLISDNLNSVLWVNEAYKRMVTSRDGCERRSPEIVVWLVIKQELPYTGRAFTCQMSVRYKWREQRCSKLVPCDVWRMDFGGYVWRLDLNAALSLGL